jgi:peptidoglycan L-alanyl-D-glutamate endopeptidase CwlK
MSVHFKDDTLFYQRFLKSNLFYTGKLDGDWGPRTDAADKAFQQQCGEIAAAEGTFDNRSETNIVTLAPKAQIAVRRFLKLCKDAGKDVRILSGTRTYAEQNALYAQGRTKKPGPIVTRAKGGQSNHNFGIAWDIGIFKGGQYITDDKQYKALAEQILPQMADVEWGGNWKSLQDFPHYQLKALSDDLGVVRGDFEAGNPYV